MRADASTGLDVAPIGRPRRWLVAVLSPVALTVLGVGLLAGTVGPEPFPQAPLAVYAAANVLVVALLARLVSASTRKEIVRYRRPSGTELAAGVAVAVVAVTVVDPLADAVVRAIGLGGGDGTAAVETTVGAAVLAVSAIVVAPVAEEVLYRGLALGSLRTRRGVPTAVAGSSLLFGAVHLFTGGAVGAVGAVLSGILYAVLRVHYDNLVGASLAHAGNNAYFVAVALGILPDLVPW